jgi:predicted ATPase/DNA-binding SARP family transcriptional activator
MEFRLFGPLEVIDDQVSLPLGGLKQRAVLAILLLRANQVVSADELLDGVWGESPPPSAGNALQVYVSQLRKILRAGRAKSESADRLVSHPSGYTFRVDADDLDVWCFERLATEGREALVAGNEADAAAKLAQALALTRGAPLQDFRFEAFAQDAIERIEEQMLQTYEDKVEAELALGRHHESLAELQSKVRSHPLRERLREHLMLALYRAGQQADALESFRHARALFADELGIDPTPRLQRLNEQILRQDSALLASPDDARTPRTEEARRLEQDNGLPHRLSTFVGRAELLAEATKLLDVNRLLTLTGPGGTGKTRASVEIGDSMSREGWAPWFVDLASLREDSLVEDAVLRSLGVTARGEEGVAAATTVMRLHSSLILLDNCEQVREGAGATVLRLVSEVPELRIIATSREPLGIEGEVTLRVPPLELPLDASEEQALTNEAVRLFNDRAAAASPGFQVDSGNLGAVVEICRRLAGLPLGIELAAARTRSFGVAEIAKLLGDHIDLLGRPAAGRHATMTATIDWSVDLLTNDERVLFTRLAVFDGPFTLEAASAVVADDGLEAVAIPGLIANLVDKSLLTPEPTEWHTIYRFLEPIRQRAADLLRIAPESDALAERLATWIAYLAEQAEPLLRGVDYPKWHDWLVASLPDLRKSLRWAIEHGRGDLAARAMGNLTEFMLNTPGEQGEWRHWSDEVARSPDLAPGDLALALTAASAQAFTAYDMSSVVRLAEDAIRLSEPHSLAYFSSTIYLGSALREQRAYEEAVLVHEAAVREARACEKDWFEARSLYSLGLVELFRERLSEAWKRFDEGLSIFLQLGDAVSAIETYYYRYTIAVELADDRLAAEALAGIDRLAPRTLAANVAIASPLSAKAAIEGGDLYAGLAIALDGFEQLIRIGYLQDAAEALSSAGRVVILLGRHELGVALIAAAEKVCPPGERYLPARWYRPLEETILQARDRLGPEMFADAWLRGCDTPPELLLSEV